MTTKPSKSRAALWRASEHVRRRGYRTQLVQTARQRLRVPAPPITRPIFLVGTVRAGTTFLSRCIGAHPGVLLAGFELLPEWAEYAGIEIATPGVECAHCPAVAGPDLAAFDDARVALIRDRFAALHVRKGGWRHTRLMNKNPHLWNKLDLIHRVFPDASFIVASRDLVSTVASTKRLWSKLEQRFGIRHALPEDPTACWSCSPPMPADRTDPARTFPGGDVRVLAAYWLRVFERIERELRDHPRRVVLRHRAFVEDPGGTLRRTFEGLELPIVSSRLPEAVQHGRNQRWRSILAPDEIDRLTRWIDAHRDRIEALTLAETSLATDEPA